ncbi:two-component sensor histidine kinase [Flavobacterium cutihirudinis]|uniref:histidine kinase n=1 Tax=Flavobacterium cutihirudinis TaxID=1265740 RepID=A0A3D9FQB9_9FLAO|nr:histidine kinase dimerization/phosphoacceptor domain -containing protein [Flavobacterium cutihirudinis]RED22679.1 two-component sensor histidine kinase [Flavobacterium cutihirudinis]
MNFIPIISVKNHVRALFTVTFFILVNYSVPAQSKEDPNVLKSKIAKAGDTSQKVDLLLLLSAYYLNKDHEYKADLDEADVINGQARQLGTSLHYKTGIGKSILLNAQINREKGDPKNGLKKAKEALVYSKKNNLTELQANAYLELSMYGESLDERIKYKEMAIPLFIKLGAKAKQAGVLKETGELYLMNENEEKGMVLLKESLLLYQSIKFPHLQGVYNLLSDGYTHTGNFAEALKYALLAEKTALAVRDSSLQLSAIYNHVGMAYLNLQKKNNAAEYFYKGLEIAKKHKSADYVRVIGDNLCSTFILQKKGNDALKLLKEMQASYPSNDEQRQIKENYLFLGIYRVLNDNEKATVYYNKLVAYYGKYAEKSAENGMPILRSFARYHYQLKNYTDLYPILHRLDSLATASKNTIMLSDNYLIWFKADSSRGKYLDAIKHYQLYKNILDTIYKGETNRQINNLQIEFDTDKKDRNIELLTQQAKVQQIQIQKDNVVKYVFIGSVLVLILILGLLYNSFRIKKKKNEELEIKRQQINEQNELNKKMLIEKEWLLKEIHHRVKNNLQIVISLLNTQSAYLDNEDALLAIQNSQHRMYAMSLIHQKLYQSDNLSNIDMSWYIYELINYMKECYDTKGKINFVLEIESICLDVAQAVPMGLIINEAISNAIKYAFPNDRKGEILISFKNIEKNNCQLIIADNGVGLPENFNHAERDSLGMNLMTGLSDQIDGVFEMKNDNGLKIKITFNRNTEFETVVEDSEISSMIQ